MRWVRYRLNNLDNYGIMSDDGIQEVCGSPFDSYEATGIIISPHSVDILIPVVPRTFYAAGINYEEHVRETAILLGIQPSFPSKPDIGYRANNALIPNDASIIIPQDATEKVHYEGELVVVIGEKAKNLSEDDALSCVLGYTIGNDVSERNWQASDRTMWRSKNTDTFKPMGPWIETEANIDDMVTKIYLNGVIVNEFVTKNMIFGVAKYISIMTRYLTLYPGDVIWMGTDGASEDLQDGDLVEIEITGIGTLRNPVTKER